MDKDVYIIFGSIPCGDGCNIHGVYANEEDAEREMVFLNETTMEDYHIEEFFLHE